jgi:hypothetical protein
MTRTIVWLDYLEHTTYRRPRFIVTTSPLLTPIGKQGNSLISGSIRLLGCFSPWSPPGCPD